MANPLGRPRGKGPGKYTNSPANIAANRMKAKLPRPGMRKDTDEEKARAYEADRIGRTLCLEVVEQASRYLRDNLLVLKRFDEVLSDPWSTAEKIEAVRAARLSPTELTRMLEAVHNRWGTPPRTIQDVNMRDMVPDYLGAARETENWDAPPEDTHARPAGNGHAGNGAAH